MSLDERIASLSEQEREILRLLSQGHTVKSISQVTGKTQGAINERLREARRKTGQMSSRELARMLAAQENCDEKLGVAPASVVMQCDDVKAVKLPWPSKGTAVLIGMISIALVGSLAVIQSSRSDPSSSVDELVAKGDPILDGVIQNEDDPRRRYLLVRSEARDVAWASKTERGLHYGYTKAMQGYGVTPERILCKSSICEVAIQDLNPKIGTMGDLANDLQGGAFIKSVAEIGLVPSSATFGKAYVGYWKRKVL